MRFAQSRVASSGMKPRDVSSSAAGAPPYDLLGVRLLERGVEDEVRASLHG